MTDAPSGNGYTRKHYTLDENTVDTADDLAASHHNGNSSEAVRASIRFRDRWSTRDKSLPTEIIHALNEVLSSLDELEREIELLNERIADTERAANDGTDDDVDRARQKRKVMHALSATEGRRIDTVADETSLSLSDAIEAAEELEDNDRIVRTNGANKEVRFKKLG